MGSKKKEIVWHKKRGKFIVPKLTKGHLVHEDEAPSEKGDHRRQFAQDLASKIKKAVQP